MSKRDQGEEQPDRECLGWVSRCYGLGLTDVRVAELVPSVQSMFRDLRSLWEGEQVRAESAVNLDVERPGEA